MVSPTLTIKNYKSISKTTLKLKPGLNILVGPNGSGKTCVLSSLRFLRDVFTFGAAQALAKQGGALRVYKHNSEEMEFIISNDYGLRLFKRKKIPCTFIWKIKIAQAGDEKIATIVEEDFKIFGKTNDKNYILCSLGIKRHSNNKNKIENYLIHPSKFGRDLFSSWDRKYDDYNKIKLHRLFLTEWSKRTIEHYANKNDDRSFFPAIAEMDKVLAQVHELFQFLNEYNIAPDIARESTEQLPYARMLPNGRQVSEVIEALENKRFHKLRQAMYLDLENAFMDNQSMAYKHRYFQFYQYKYLNYSSGHRLEDALDNINIELSAAVKPISHVSISIEQNTGKRYIVFNAKKDEFLPEEVSDGTIKWLCILVSLFVPFSKVYLLEEPENFLHPWMQQRLISLMRERAEINNTVFLLSSHSSTVLNSAYPEEILIVSQKEIGTQVTKIQDLEDIQKVLSNSDFHIGDLWVSGLFGGVPTNE